MDLNQWIDQQTRKSVSVQKRVDVALQFLRHHYGVMNEQKILSEIRCIDFSRPVETPTMPPGTVLVGSKDPRVSPYRGAYFTKPGHPADRLGIASEGNLSHRGKVIDPKTRDKVLYRYEVLVMIPKGEVLQSICAPAKDHWSIAGRQVLVAGGGVQFLIPRMNRYLRYLSE